MTRAATLPTHPLQVRVKERAPNVKHVTYYLLVSISFPYIHTRQVGHDEGLQLLVIGELEHGRHRALGGPAGQSCHLGVA